jgi:hypothetical protein
MLPYYAWNNRGVSQMNVWFPESENVAKENISEISLLLKEIKASHTDGVWKAFPLYSTDSYSLLKDRFNPVHSDGDSFVVKAIRLNMTSKPDSAVGISQVKFDIK